MARRQRKNLKALAEAEQAGPPELVRRLYVEQGLSQREIARLLEISRDRLVVVLTGLGLERGNRARQPCPFDAAELRRLVGQGESAGSLARRYRVSWDTARRWLTDAGLLAADPGIDPVRLRELYVEQQLTTREVAARLKINRGRVLRALVSAGIRARPRSHRRPNAPRARS